MTTKCTVTFRPLLTDGRTTRFAHLKEMGEVKEWYIDKYVGDSYSHDSVDVKRNRIQISGIDN